MKEQIKVENLASCIEQSSSVISSVLISDHVIEVLICGPKVENKHS